MNFRLGFALAPIVFLTAFTFVQRDVDYINLDRHADPLRATFNADSGKVRVVMLVAPT